MRHSGWLEKTGDDQNSENLPLQPIHLINAYPEGLAFAVLVQFSLYSTIQVLVTGVDPWAALAVWPLVAVSSVAVIVYYLLIVLTLKLGDMSVYYPITRSSPLFVVVLGWRLTPGRYLIAGLGSYLSYYLILMAFNLGGNVAAVASLRQISIPVSVILGALFLGELYLARRMAWSAMLAAGVVIILVAR